MPFSPRKTKLILILTALILTGLTSYSFAQEKTTFKGLYPIPFVSLNQFILHPRSAVSMANCNTGTVYIDENTGQLIVCGQNNGKSKNVWTQNGNAVFPTNNDPELSIAINNNTISPHIFNIFGTQNVINFDVRTASSNISRLTLNRTAAMVSGAADYIDFHTGKRGEDFDSRIIYRLYPPDAEGFVLYGSFSNSEQMFIKKSNHNVGIGMEIPSERLDINGEIETNKMILDQDGTLGANPPAELKVTYTAGGGGGYYAVYAP